MTRKLEWTTVIVAVIAAIGTLGAARLAYIANENATKATNAVEITRLELAARNRQNELDIKAYELVEKTLSLGPASRKGHGVAAAAIVNALTKPPLRNGLQNALRAGVTDPALIEAIDKARQFDLEEYALEPSSKVDSRLKKNKLNEKSSSIELILLSTTAWASTPVSAMSDQRIDIFYCEANTTSVTNSRKNRAAKALTEIAHIAPKTIVRVRLLPTLVQARPGYQSFSDELRYRNTAFKGAAEGLAQAIGLNIKMVHQSETKTSAEIGVFFCNGS